MKNFLKAVMREILKKKRPFSLRYLILLGLLLAAAAIWFLLRSGLAQKEIRHVILISIDTCRADYLSCYGFRRQTTPNIDAIAAEGVLFENVITPSPITRPGHSSMLTGTDPPYHGVHDNYDYRLGQSNVTLAEMMRQAGFQTAAIIGAFVMDSKFGLNQGFDTYNDRFDKDIKSIVNPERRGEEVSHYGMKWLQQHHREPFFLFLHYFDPHQAYIPPEPFASAFQYNLYAGEIAYTDKCIGLVIKKLKQLNLYDSTLIIITSDHGEMLGEHGEPTHSYFIYQSAIKVPLIFKLPGRRKSRIIRGMAGLIDIVPTVCSLLGIEVPKQVRGKDLSSCLLGKNLPDRERHIYCESFCPTIYNANSLLGVVTDRFKYIQTTRPELYDLAKDPYETNNLIKLQPQRGRILQDRLREILEQTVRKDELDSKMELDEQSRKTLESLGYVSGGVSVDFTFDQSKDDPKDLLSFYVAEVNVFALTFEKKYAEAKILCRKMLSERPDYEGTYIYLSKMAEEEGDKAKAITYLAEALKLNPDNIQIRNKLAVMLIQQHKSEEAIKHLTESLRREPDQFETHNDFGFLLQLQGKLDEAISHHRRALQIKPDFDKSHNNLGLALASQGKLDEAISHYRRALQINPDFAQAHNNLGVALARQEKLNEAITHFIEVVRLDPNSAKAHYTLARALEDGGRTKEAITEFKETLRLRPNQVGPMNSLAWLLATHKENKFRNPEEAIRLAERACEVTKYEDAGLVDTLAAAYAASGRFSDAVATAEKAVKLAASTGNKERTEEIQNRLELYKRGQPYYD